MSRNYSSIVRNLNIKTSNATEVYQANHGFSIGNILYRKVGEFALAKANSKETSQVVGMISNILSIDTFELTFAGGFVSGLSGLQDSKLYYLSDSISGSMTTSMPIGIGSILKPVFRAMSSSSGFVIGDIAYSEDGINIEALSWLEDLI